MPPLSNQGVRPLAATAVAATPQSSARPANGAAASAGPAITQGIVDRDSNVRLSAQALNGAVADAGKSTVQVARQFMESLAGAVFGDAARGASLSFDSVKLESAASFAASASHASAVDGASSSSAIALSESAHFIGSGQLTLEDGQTYDVEVEVRYEASVSMANTETRQKTPHEPTPDMILTGKQLPAIKYPGPVEDLFKLLGRELSTEGGDPGKLALRLIRLVDRAILLAPRLPAEEVAPTAAARQMAASAYASASAVEG